jgi:hypothetical protein
MPRRRIYQCILPDLEELLMGKDDAGSERSAGSGLNK